MILTQNMSIAMVPKTLMIVSFGAYALINAKMKQPKPRKTPKTTVDLTARLAPVYRRNHFDLPRIQKVAIENGALEQCVWIC